MKHRHHDHSRPTANGHVRRGASEPVAETRFFWRDPETGERLEVALGVSDAFRERLTAAGFQPTVGPTGSQLDLASARAHARAAGHASGCGSRESGRPGDSAGSAAPAA